MQKSMPIHNCVHWLYNDALILTDDVTMAIVLVLYFREINSDRKSWHHLEGE